MYGRIRIAGGGVRGTAVNPLYLVSHPLFFVFCHLLGVAVVTAVNTKYWGETPRPKKTHPHTPLVYPERLPKAFFGYCAALFYPLAETHATIDAHHVFF